MLDAAGVSSQTHSDSAAEKNSREQTRACRPQPQNNTEFEVVFRGVLAATLLKSFFFFCLL